MQNQGYFDELYNKLDILKVNTRRFFTAPIRAAAAALPAERAVAYTLDRLEGAVAVGAAQQIISIIMF